jgi:predicted TIM-barrel fold metal-dependent hydrolase
MPEGVFDAVVHPRMLTSGQIADHMKEPYRSLRYNSADRFILPAPTGIPPYGEWLKQSRPDGEIITTAAGTYTATDAGSVPARTFSYLAETGASDAILLPMLRGVQPAVDQGNAICAAYNDWLADTWLKEAPEGIRLWGTIRVNPEDPEGAAEEIGRWASHPRMLQVGVPLEAHRPYGQRNYLPIWEAAAANSLPVMVKADGGVGVDYFPTMLGLPRTHIEFSALHRDRFFMHLASFIAEGAFDRFPELMVVFADGGFDYMTPAMWRMDMDWPISRSEVPWVKQLPSKYLRTNVRFIADRLEGPPDADADTVAEWVRRTDGEHLLMYGSRYPHWSSARPEQILPRLDADARNRILRGNATEIYAARLQLATAR